MPFTAIAATSQIRAELERQLRALPGVLDVGMTDRGENIISGVISHVVPEDRRGELSAAADAAIKQASRDSGV